MEDKISYVDYIDDWLENNDVEYEITMRINDETVHHGAFKTIESLEGELGKMENTLREHISQEYDYEYEKE